MSIYHIYNRLIHSNLDKTTNKIANLIQEKDPSLKLHSTQRYVRKYKQRLRINNEITKRSSTNSTNNVLIIADLHAPFSLEGYLEYCIEIYNKFNCGKVIFIGDLIDNSASSYHELNPNGYSAREELNLAIDQIREWYKHFPEAIVLNGNHDCLNHRKAKTSGLDKRWIKENKEVLQVSNWTFLDNYIYNGVFYTHGHQTKEAFQECLLRQMPVVSGHRHSKCYIKYQTSNLWGMQVGVGFNKDAYAFDYARGNTTQWIENVSVVLNNVPILQPFTK